MYKVLKAALLEDAMMRGQRDSRVGHIAWKLLNGTQEGQQTHQQHGDGHAQDLHRTASASASNSVMYADGSILVASGNALFDQQGKAGAIAFLFRRGKTQTGRYRQSNTLATTETFLAPPTAGLLEPAVGLTCGFAAVGKKTNSIRNFV